VDNEGKLILSGAVHERAYADEYARQYLAGKIFARSMSGRERYFAWHRASRFRGETA
jgi:hypothetical protein